MAEKSLRRTRKGTVVSKSGNKSIVVLVETRRKHPLYKKVVTYSKKFHVHDEENVAVVGDKVEIIECRPVSRLKRWRLNKVDQQI
jgi:small subunit ribosomal protein S17